MSAKIIQFPGSRQAAPLLNLAELIEVFGYSERFWRYRIAEGMPTHRWAHRLRFRVDEVESWLQRRYSDGAA